MSDSIKKYFEMQSDKEEIELLKEEIRLAEKRVSDLREKLNKYIK